MKPENEMPNIELALLFLEDNLKSAMADIWDRLMKLVRQPLPSSLCGQACVATLAGITLDEAIMVMRTKGRTTRKKVAQALRQLGIVSTDKLKRGFPECETAIMKYTHPEGDSHWVIWHKKKYYDPAAGTFRREPKYLSGSRVTSHMEIYL